MLCQVPGGTVREHLSFVVCATFAIHKEQQSEKTKCARSKRIHERCEANNFQYLNLAEFFK